MPLISRLPLPKASTLDVPPSDFWKKKICPPWAPFMPPLTIRVADSAVEDSWEIVRPRFAVLEVLTLAGQHYSIASFAA
jgi:hypothetical protein